MRPQVLGLRWMPICARAVWNLNPLEVRILLIASDRFHRLERYLAHARRAAVGPVFQSSAPSSALLLRTQ